MQEKLKQLLDVAKASTAEAYAPYSGYRVGSAILCTDGRIYSGCNIENSSYSLTVCAERTAIFKAVSEGCKDFDAIAIYVDSEHLFPPCGACRQVIAEFNPHLKVIYANKIEIVQTDLSALLPGAFSLVE